MILLQKSAAAAVAAAALFDPAAARSARGRLLIADFIPMFRPKQGPRPQA